MLFVAGVGLRGSGYPNARGTLDALRASGEWVIRDCARWLPEDVHLWRVTRGSVGERVHVLATLALGSAISLVETLLRGSRSALVYAPYPAVFVLFWASFLPRRIRPRIVADAYISIWDATVRDRGQGRNITGPMSRLLRWFEGRALRAAHRVIVDTEANRDWMLKEFGLSEAATSALPLAIDADALLGLPSRVANQGPMRVLFVGTLIPLHGLEVIADAVRLLDGEGAIEFEFIGDGQEAGVLEELTGTTHHTSINWRRTWATSEEVVERIAHADVCLGVFGGDAKASRVLPLKVYMALAAGRVVVTQSAMSWPGGAGQPPCRAISPDAETLASCLRDLARAPKTRHALGARGRAYFHEMLSQKRIVEVWRKLD